MNLSITRPFNKISPELIFAGNFLIKKKNENDSPTYHHHIFMKCCMITLQIV